jgi:hypothetical protein
MSRKNRGKGKQKKVIENEEDEKEYIVEAIVDRRLVKLIPSD